MNDITALKSHEDFNWARGKEMLSRIQFFMHPDKEKLLSFHDVKHILRPRGEAYLGMMTVPINLIVGSEGRYKDFNKFFLPKNDHVRARWESVDRAHIKDIVLPPIQL
ncbi:MAG: transcriptional regulator, partial [Spirochaetaceae bacterium]|nr:transcriptional regulator [Spirochaetaceae bacterium]